MMANETRFSRLRQQIEGLRANLVDHPLHRQLSRLENLQHFMQFHIFAVWDFMSLLKALQQKLGGTGTPWLPHSDPVALRFINEIVLAEESDVDRHGGFASHFILYHRAMQQCGASTDWMDRFLSSLKEQADVALALKSSDAPEAVLQFVGHTFSVVEGGQLIELASTFTVGREDLLPELFQQIIPPLNVQTGGKLTDFAYYLSRHIELDGDHHGPMSQQLLSGVCRDDDDAWQRATLAAEKALQARKDFWDAIADSMPV